MNEDLKTYIPGVGFLVTSWDGSEGFIVPEAELTAPEGRAEERTAAEIAYDEAEAEAMARYEARYYEEGK
jgi:hypothetical protein